MVNCDMHQVYHGNGSVDMEMDIMNGRAQYGPKKVLSIKYLIRKCFCFHFLPKIVISSELENVLTRGKL